MRRLRARLRVLGLVVGLGVSGIVVLLAVATMVTARSGNSALWPPRPGEPRVEIFIVSHGYHSGLVLPREALAEVAGRRGHAALGAAAQRFASYRTLEIGWGDEKFYRSVPDVASLTIRLALRALFLPGNASVVHVVGMPGHARDVFPRSDIIRVELSDDGFARMLEALEASFRKDEGGAVPAPLGPGLYGPSLFYRGVDTFHVFNVCNHWVARLLSAAGLPTAPVPATLPPGLFLDLRWRAGLAVLPKS